MKPGQPLGRPASDLLMRVAGRLSNRLPTGTGVRNRWIRPRFIRAPHRQPQPFPLPVGALDPFFFASASGSVTVTTTARPARRRRRCAVAPCPSRTTTLVSATSIRLP